MRRYVQRALVRARASALWLIEPRRRRAPGPPHGRSVRTDARVAAPYNPRTLRRASAPGAGYASNNRVPAARGTGHSPEPTGGDSKATGRAHGGAGAGTGSTRTDAPATGHPPRRPGPHGRRPRGRADLARGPPSATSATTRFRKNWAAAAWASSTRPDRSSSTAPSPSR